MSKVLFEKVEADLRVGDKPITVEEAKKMLGWQPESEGPAKGFGTNYVFIDFEGNKIRMTNNTCNRPFRPTLAKNYANEMLRKKWKMNGEPIIFDNKGMVQSGQHRLAGIILAEQMRKKAVDKWRDRYNWRSAISIESLVVTGISDRPEVTDTLDGGAKRTLMDVIFRNEKFDNGQPVKGKEQKKLSSILAMATRLVWERQGGKLLSDAAHFPNSEALEFVREHEGLVDCVLFIFNEDGEGGADGRLVGSFISLGYAAGLLYLMGSSGTDRVKYDQEGPEALDWSMEDQAQEFWVKFAAGADLKKGSPILALRNLLPKINPSGAAGKNEVIGTVIKAFNLFVDKKKTESAKDIRVKRKKDDDGRTILSEVPRLGGIDVEVEKPQEPKEETPEAKPKKEKPKPFKASKSKDGWAKDDKAWVKDEEGSWPATVLKVWEVKDNGQWLADVRSEEDGKEYEVPLTFLVVKKPK